MWSLNDEEDLDNNVLELRKENRQPKVKYCSMNRPESNFDVNNGREDVYQEIESSVVGTFHYEEKKSWTNRTFSSFVSFFFSYFESKRGLFFDFLRNVMRKINVCSRKMNERREISINWT